MNIQPEALRLADQLEGWFFPDDVSMVAIDVAAAELRRLHALNAELVKALQALFKWTSIRTSVADTIVGAQKEREEAIKRARAAIAKAGEQLK